MIDPGAPTLPSGPLVDFQAVRDAIQSVKLLDKRVLKLIRAEERRRSVVAAAASSTFSLNFSLSGGGAALYIGNKGALRVDYNCRIDAVYLQEIDGITTGNLTLWLHTSRGGPSPTLPAPVWTPIFGATPPTLAVGQRYYEDLALTDWTRELVAGTYIRYFVLAVSAIRMVNVDLLITR